MSWSISFKGNPVAVKEYFLSEVISPKMAHVQGKEREVALSAVELLAEICDATTEPKFEISANAYGSAIIKEGGVQTGQTLGLTATLEWKG
jgi:hypothetical protein